MSTNIRPKVAYGLSEPNFRVPLEPIISNRDPLISDYAVVGTEWINGVTNQVWVLTSVVANQAIWTRVDNTNVNAGITWTTQAGVGPIVMNGNYGYNLTNAGTVTLVLPAVAALGSQIWISDDNAAAPNAGFTIDQNAGQYFLHDNISSTVGVLGYLDAVNFFNRSIAMIIVCTIANTEFTVFSTNIDVNLV